MYWLESIKNFFRKSPTAIVESSATYDPTAFNERLVGEATTAIQEDLVSKAKTVPLTNLDGKPNPKWVEMFQLGFPNLLQAEIEAKQQELIKAELAIIDAFLDKEDVEVDASWIDELKPEIKIDELGLWHVKIHGQWAQLADPAVLHENLRK